MWNSGDARARIEDEWQTRWFDFPFGVSERCKLIDDWESGKHNTDGKKPSKLSDDMKQSDGVQFLRDYEAMILGFCQKKWPKLTTATEKAQLENGEAQFVFADDGQVDSKMPIMKRKNKNMTDALFYYSSQVIDSKLRDRLLRLKEKKEDKGKKISWKEAKELFLQYMEKPKTLSKLYSLFCLKRQNGEAAIDWVQSVMTIL